MIFKNLYRERQRQTVCKEIIFHMLQTRKETNNTATFKHNLKKRYLKEHKGSNSL